MAGYGTDPNTGPTIGPGGFLEGGGYPSGGQGQNLGNGTSNTSGSYPYGSGGGGTAAAAPVTAAGYSLDSIYIDWTASPPQVYAEKRGLVSDGAGGTTYGYTMAPMGDITNVAAIAAATGIPAGAITQKIQDLTIQHGVDAGRGNDLGNWQAISANPDGTITVKNGYNQVQNVKPDVQGNLINAATGQPFQGIAAGQVQYLLQQQSERTFQGGAVNTFGYGTNALAGASAPQYGLPSVPGAPVIPAASPTPSPYQPPGNIPAPIPGSTAPGGPVVPGTPTPTPAPSPGESPPGTPPSGLPPYPVSTTGSESPGGTPPIGVSPVGTGTESTPSPYPYAPPTYAAATPTPDSGSSQPYQYTAPTYSAQTASGASGASTADTGSATTTTAPNPVPAVAPTGTASSTPAATTASTTPGAGLNVNGTGMNYQQYQQQLQMLQAYNNTISGQYQAANAGAIQGQQTVSRNQYLNQAQTNSMSRNLTGRGFSGMGTQAISGQQG